MSKRTLLILLLLNVIWAGSYSATKVLMQHAPYFLVTSLRYLAAALPLLILAGRRHGLRMPPGDILRSALMGVSTFTLCPLLMYKGVSLSRASDAAVITAMEPLLVSLGAWIYLRERIGRRTAAALAVSFGGTIVLSQFWRQGESLSAFGIGLILAGVFFEAGYSVIGKEILRRHPPLKIVAVAVGAACLVNVTAISVLGYWPQAANLTAQDWSLLVVYLALLCTVVGYTFWFVALRQDSAAKVAITIYCQPVLGVLIAWAWVDEVPTTWMLIGAAVILIGVSIAVVPMRPAVERSPIVS
ncbi:MAG: DMT family transporter [Candidatus Alcyoniella australis]|nr:DMT family transporter [Candidatus Alcyoniella australis]